MKRFQRSHCLLGNSRGTLLLWLLIPLSLCAAADVDVTPGQAPPQDAAEYYRRAFARVARMPDAVADGAEAVVTRDWGAANQAVLDFIPPDRGVVELCLTAATMPQCNFLGQTILTAQTQLPHLERSRDLSRYLLLKGKYFSHRHAYQDALNCYVANFALANHLARDGVVLGRLIGLTIESAGNLAMAEVHTFPETFRRRALRAWIDQISQRQSLEPMLRRELEFVCREAPKTFDEPFIMEQFGQVMDQESLRLFKRYGLLETRRIGGWYVGWAYQVFDELAVASRLQYFISVTARFGEIIDRHGLDQKSMETGAKPIADKLLEAAGISFERLTVDAELRRKYLAMLDRTYRVMLAMIIPSVESTLKKDCGERFASEAVALQLALGLFNDNTGAFPDDLNELVPILLPSPPVDPFTGSPLHYRRSDDSYVFYSVGPDLVDSEGMRLGMVNGREFGDLVYYEP